MKRYYWIEFDNHSSFFSVEDDGTRAVVAVVKQCVTGQWTATINNKLYAYKKREQTKARVVIETRFPDEGEQK